MQKDMYNAWRELLNKIPLSVVSLGQEEIEKAGMRSLNDIAANAVGFSMEKPLGINQIFLLSVVCLGYWVLALKKHRISLTVFTLLAQAKVCRLIL